MTLNLRNIFRPSNAVAQNRDAVSQVNNSEDLQQGETFEHWGMRVCAITNGSVRALTPYLQRVYNYIYQNQVNNQVLQEQQRARIRSQMDQKQCDIDNYNIQLDRNRMQKDGCRAKIGELQEEMRKLMNNKYLVNKDEKLKLIIGLVILLPLTFYLFLFYSSTFYSAFFRDSDTMTNMFEAMFDPQTFEHALNRGAMALFFCLCAPTIFLGLGFRLHFFSIQKSVMKYLKMAGLLCVTFSFDAILAYKIGEQFHALGQIIGTIPLEIQYGIENAMTDINTWTVIFCGFIAYIIWGIVFDMVMSSAHGALDLTKTNLLIVKKKIMAEHDKIAQCDFIECELYNKINEAQRDRNTLSVQIVEHVFVDNGEIRREMTDFYTGWITQMGVLRQSRDDQAEAEQTFNNTLTLLIA